MMSMNRSYTHMYDAEGGLLSVTQNISHRSRKLGEYFECTTHAPKHQNANASILTTTPQVGPTPLLLLICPRNGKAKKEIPQHHSTCISYRRVLKAFKLFDSAGQFIYLQGPKLRKQFYSSRDRFAKMVIVSMIRCIIMDVQ